MLSFDPAHEPPEPKDAATLLVVRHGSGGLELFFVRRHAKSPFLGGAVVFPGGKLDAGDAQVAATDGLHPRAAAFGDAALALAVCACRESLEEAAILPTTPAIDHALARRARAELEAGSMLDAIMANTLGGCRIATAALVPFARWVTPRAESRRYDARFFLAPLPPGQEGRHDERETVSGVWATPDRMLAAFAAGDVFLAPPTVRALELLCEASSVEAAIALCAEQSLEPICPTFVPGDPPMLVLPGDPLHEISERRVAGGTRFVLRDGKFLSEEAPGSRLRAPGSERGD